MVIVRLIEERDNQVVGEIVQDSLKSRGLNIPGTAYFDPHLFSLYGYYQEPKRAYWVLEKEGKVVGGCGIGPFGVDEAVGELQKLYIRDEEQGNGYAHVLMKKALDFAKVHYKGVYIDTFASLKEANKLYEKYGFEKLEAPISGSDHNACDTWFYKAF